MSLKRGTYQGPPTVVANLQGTLVASTYGQGPTFVSREDPQRFRRTVELGLENGRYLGSFAPKVVSLRRRRPPRLRAARSEARHS